ncbi:hypothetical protein MMAN_00370 [Mycobacterium mantenii]|uniref:DUF4189 domain-containing protein n=2 Tax=Mycobacterium mantenii TaxID=560555 RepID=A0A1X0G5E1_MYCNT|nr:DUF3761 domain-containing protein [Mycobacterium mantenii]ORB08710.1 hypothetical protein BST30_01860 [Mycobacterium mantenii]BBY35903.1 hypothetical protein MMAN_00370 [Mycobacterium mantenii]
MRSIIAVAIIAVGYGTIAVAAPPIAAANECPPGFYWSKAHSTCVERPDNNPVGAVALCGDGNYSHSESRSGTCSDNDGIRQWCPCGGAPSLASAPAAGAAPDDDDYVSLAVSLVTGLPAGWGTAGSQDKANQIAVDQCNASTGGVCEAVAGMHNGCASVAIDPDAGRFQGGYGSDTTASNADALTELDSPSGVIAASHCSS